MWRSSVPAVTVRSAAKRDARRRPTPKRPAACFLGLIAAKTGPRPRSSPRARRWPAPWIRERRRLRAARGRRHSASGVLAPEKFDAFDLAPYRIAPDQPAFGLRGSWMEGYSGGGADFGGLCLFARDGKRLRQVSALGMSPMSTSPAIGTEDGTRDHDVTDAANVMIVSNHLSDGHFDLIVKAREGRTATLRWSKASVPTP